MKGHLATLPLVLKRDALILGESKVVSGTGTLSVLTWKSSSLDCALPEEGYNISSKESENMPYVLSSDDSKV